MLMVNPSNVEVAERRRPGARIGRLLAHPAPWLAAAVGVMALRIGADRMVSVSTATSAGFVSVGLCVVAMGLALGQMARAIRHGRVGSTLGHAVLAAFSAFGAFVALVVSAGLARGRQLRRFGRVLLPRLRSGSDWTTSTAAFDAHKDAPAGLADQWRENGKTEHASVAAFARLTLDLLALGAPPALIAAANRDALDEIRHAEICFSLAHALDGRAMSPAPFAEAQTAATLPRLRTLALAKLAVDSLVDGALHEGVSARIIARLAQRCEVESIRAGLKEIAADEGRHSAHGWAVAAWCLEQGGAPVAAALQGALRALPREMRSPLPEAAARGEWERWGIQGHALEAEQYAATVAHVEQRVREMTAARLSRAA
jgi:hypothetical protein